MKELNFRTLTADEIECRVSQCGKSAKGVAWCSLLLYKDARCDQRLLDETVGAYNWQRKHSRDNANCTVSIWDEEKKMWIEKEDTGVESNTEKEKGLASDSFKRACFNWGIGRELYSSPKIFITLNSGEYTELQGKIKVNQKTSFEVTDIGYDEKRNICKLTICDGDGKQRFVFASGKNILKQTPIKEETPHDDADLYDAFKTIEDNIKTAPSRAELQNIHAQNEGLWNYKPFTDALNKRWSEVA